MKKYIVLIFSILFVHFGFSQPCTIGVDFENEVINLNPFSGGIYSNPTSNWRRNPGGVVFGFWKESNGNQFLTVKDKGDAASYISNVTDFTGDLLPPDVCDATLCFDVMYSSAGSGGYNGTSFVKTIYFFSPDNGPGINNPGTVVARFSLFNPIPVGSGWSNICVPIEECSGTGLPSNSMGQWEWAGVSNLSNTCNDWNNLIHNLAGIAFNTDVSVGGHSAPSEVWAFDNFCYTQTPCPQGDCCNTPLEFTNSGIAKVHSRNYNGVAYSETSQTFRIDNDAQIPITEMRVAITDLVYDYNYEQCAQCVDNPALWGSIETPTTTIGSGTQGLQKEQLPYFGGSILTEQGNLREVIWRNPNGVLLKQGDTFDVSYFLPPLSEIPCCVTKVTICQEIRWKDANCNVCTKYLCTEIELNGHGAMPGAVESGEEEGEE